MSTEVTDGTGLVKFGTCTPEAASATRKALSGGDRKFYKMKAGSNTLRMLPPPPGLTSPWFLTYRHYIRNFGGGNHAFIENCPRKMGVGPCPACERGDALTATGNPVDSELAKDYYAKPRLYAAVIDRSDEAAGVQILGYGTLIQSGLNNLRENEDVYGADFTHPFEGQDIIITQTNSNNKIGYDVQLRHGNHARLAQTEEQMVAWLSAAPDLSKYLNVPSYAELIAKAKDLKSSATPSPEAISNIKSAPVNGTAPALQEAFVDTTADTVTAGAAGAEGLSDDSPF